MASHRGRTPTFEILRQAVEAADRGGDARLTALLIFGAALVSTAVLASLSEPYGVAAVSVLVVPWAFAVVVIAGWVVRALRAETRRRNAARELSREARTAAIEILLADELAPNGHRALAAAIISDDDFLDDQLARSVIEARRQLASGPNRSASLPSGQAAAVDTRQPPPPTR